MVTRERLLELFDVDLEAGGLFWKARPRLRRAMVGTDAGCVQCTKSSPWKRYRVVYIDGKNYLRSRLIFLLKNGRWPVPTCDHRDGNSLNDAWWNLREATHHQNGMNRKVAKARKFPRGVHPLPGGGFRAVITFKYSQTHIGVFDSAVEAEAAYRAKRAELFGEWA